MTPAVRSFHSRMVMGPHHVNVVPPEEMGSGGWSGGIIASASTSVRQFALSCVALLNGKHPHIGTRW
jgi:hypothetical protein